MTEDAASIRVRFVTEDNLISELIRQHTWCEFSHVEFVLDDGMTLGAHFSGGVAIRRADYAKFTAVDEFVVPMSAAQKKLIMDFARAQVGKAYDVGAIVGIIAHRDWRNPDKWFCSELVAAAFEQALPLVNVPANVDRVTPRDLLLSLRLRRIDGAIAPHSGAV